MPTAYMGFQLIVFFFQFIKKSFVSAAIYNVTLSLQLRAIGSKHSIWDTGSSASFHYIFSIYKMAAPTFETFSKLELFELLS